MSWSGSERQRKPQRPQDIPAHASAPLWHVPQGTKCRIFRGRYWYDYTTKKPLYFRKALPKERSGTKLFQYGEWKIEVDEKLVQLFRGTVPRDEVH